MKKTGYISMIAATLLLGACNNYEPFDYNEIEKGGYVEPTGEGTLDNPYNVSKALEVQDNSLAWVKGYIVGQVAGADIAYDSQFDAPFTGAVYDDGVSTVGTNILLAAKSDESNHSACLVVQLPKGDVRTALELLAHPDNDGKEVELYGKLTKYFGVSGMKETQAAIFNGDTLGTMPTPVLPEEGVLFTETFSSSLGEFTIDDKNLPAGLSYVWSYSSNYQCAKGSAYYQQNYIAESWLVSPAIALNGKGATLVFDHAVNYVKSDITEEVRLFCTTDGGANWTELVIPGYPLGNDFNFVSSGEIGLPVAQSIKFAFAYKSTSAGACTWEIKNVKVYDKVTAPVTPDDSGNPDTPAEDAEGDGSKENPYNVEAAKQNQGVASVWVKAYIVGQVNGDWDVNMQYDAPFTGDTNEDGSIKTYGTNLLISDNAAANTTAEVMPVQLPTGAVRLALNLVENPEMDGKEVLMYGDLTSYFSQPGLKNVTCAIVDGDVYGVDPTTVVTPEGGVIFEETFATSLGNFTTDNKVMSDAMTYVWSYDNRYTCAKASGYVSGTRYETESWLISPVMALNGNEATLTFEHAANYIGTATEEMRLFCTTDEGATWQELTIPTYATSWTFVPSGNITLPAAANVQIAFVYNSTTTNACTWEIKNVKVYQ